MTTDEKKMTLRERISKILLLSSVVIGGGMGLGIAYEISQCPKSSIEEEALTQVEKQEYREIFACYCVGFGLMVASGSGGMYLSKRNENDQADKDSRRGYE